MGARSAKFINLKRGGHEIHPDASIAIRNSAWNDKWI
jgi:hypothetical protein